MKSLLLALGVAAAASLQPRAATAGQWGCEVLLCAASSNPSWGWVPACHPPMQKLIAAMKRPGFSWPTCPEAGTGRAGYEQFEACPAGWVETSGPNQDRPGRLKSHCARTINLCEGKQRVRFGRDAESCARTEIIARRLRPQPYYFDIKDDTTGTVSKHWFSLRD